MSEVHTPSIAKDTCRLLTAGVGALVAGIAAWRALHTWRAQQKGEARFDSAKRLLMAAVAVKGFLDTGLWVMNSVRQAAVGSQRNGHGAAERAI